MSGLLVVDAGRDTTLQDGGRLGASRWGVPRSGPMDVLSHRLAARLAGATPDEVAQTAALEIGPRGVGFRAVGEPVTVAVAGVDVTIVTAGVSTPAPCVVPLEPGQDAAVRCRTWGYVVPSAVIDVPAVLGARSRHDPSGLGPAVSSDTELPLGPTRRAVVGRWPTPGLAGGPLGVLAAPQTHLFTDGARRRLVEADWRTTSAFDRMGHRLEGPELEARDGHDIVSDGIIAGAVQVPGDGQPYVLTADHQTTGGYPKIAVLARVDLQRFVRLAPGTQVRFAWTDAAAARDRWAAAVTAVEEVVRRSPRPLGTTLASTNLITGVVDPT